MQRVELASDWELDVLNMLREAEREGRPVIVEKLPVPKGPVQRLPCPLCNNNRRVSNLGKGRISIWIPCPNPTCANHIAPNQLLVCVGPLKW